MTIAYNIGIPASGNNPSADQPLMQTNNDNIATLIAVDHVGFAASGVTGTSGRHNQVTFDANNVPAVPTTPPILFTNNQDGAGTNLPGGLNQIFFYSGAAAASSNNYVTGANGSTFLFGGMIIKWGNFGISNGSGTQAVSFPVAFPNNFFSLSLLPNTTTPASGVGSVSFGGTASPAGFTAYRSNTTGGVTYFYVAIGN